jgi:hypothetical protein
MCITSFDSILVYIINILSTGLLYNYGGTVDAKITAIFLLFVGQMQLFDYIFWETQKCSLINKISTKLAIIFNHLQPILLHLLIQYYGLNINQVSKILFYIYIYASILYSINALSNVECTGNSEKTGIIYWEWNFMKYNTIFYTLFMIFMISTIFNFKDKKYSYFLNFLVILTYSSGHFKPILNETTGRIWCYYAASLPLIALTYFTIFKF